jgi:transcription elongation factor Elf1
MKARICPKCGSEDIGSIIQGDNSENKTFWQCGDCSFGFNLDNSEKIDSFDYDQGFNIEEVYDQ